MYQCSGHLLADELRFDSITREDAGDYICTAVMDDIDRSSINTTITISVGVSPKIVTKPDNQSITAGKTVRLDCNATGEPQPTIRWDRNDRILDLTLPRVKVS